MKLYFTLNGYYCIDSTQNIESIIKNKNWEYCAEEYKRVQRDCVILYRAAEKGLRNVGLAHVYRKELTDFLKMMYHNFEEIKQSGLRLPLEDYEDGIDHSSPEWCGIYLIGATHFNPITHEEFYWVKNGKAKNISKRMAQYDTCSPMTYHIDFKKCMDEKHAYRVESIYKNRLEQIAINSCAKNNEWFRVSREDYLRISHSGYKYLDSLSVENY